MRSPPHRSPGVAPELVRSSHAVGARVARVAPRSCSLSGTKRTPIPVLAAILACALARDARASGDSVVNLAANGRAVCPIVVSGACLDPKNADDPERHAAEELALFLSEISGARFELVPFGRSHSGARILVGREAASALINASEIAALSNEGYIIRAKGTELAIAGAKPRGTLYGVYSFLEDELGCRWFTPDVSRIPKNANVSVPSGDKRFVPPLEYRATDDPNSRDADWAVRNKLNGTQTRLDKRRGGKVDYSHFVHTFNEILDPAHQFLNHPDYFSEVGGKRISEHTQLCVTNPAVLKIAIETVRSWMRAAPAATIFSVSQNDWFNPCSCASCKRLYADEGDAWSGPYVRFVNAIAAAISREFPDKAVDTLAYQFTRKPPSKVKPLDNVIVRLCSIECCFAHPLDSSESGDRENAAFARDLAGWSKLSHRLYVWDYVIDYSHSIMPFPNLRSIAPNIRTFVQNGVKGVYEEADYFTPGGELAPLRTWIVAKSLWNPEYDTEHAIAEFLDGYYEDASAPLGDYIRLMHDRAKNEKFHFTIWTGPDSPLFDDATCKRADELFDAAESKVAAKPAVLERVKTARLPILYVEINRAADTVQKGGPKAPLKALIDRFDAIAKKSGVTMINEATPYDTWLASARKIAE